MKSQVHARPIPPLLFMLVNDSQDTQRSTKEEQTACKKEGGHVNTTTLLPGCGCGCHLHTLHHLPSTLHLHFFSSALFLGGATYSGPHTHTHTHTHTYIHTSFPFCVHPAVGLPPILSTKDENDTGGGRRKHFTRLSECISATGRPLYTT